jgi:hypothetical protein
MAFSEGYHRTFHDDPPLPDNLHRELSRRMLEAIEPEHRSVYEAPLTYANQQTQRQRLKFLIGRASAAVPALADPKDRFRNASSQLVTNTRTRASRPPTSSPTLTCTTASSA